LSTEPAVARANQNDFDPVRQFYDRADTLAKQGHTVDKVEIIVLGGTWSGYPRDYQEEFCRDLFYAANTFDEDLSKLGERGEAAAATRPKKSILEEQQLNEKARAKIIGLTQEKEPVIFDAIKFGSVVENAIISEKRVIDFHDVSITQNTRCAYPLHYVKNAVIPAVVDRHPNNVVLLTCDGFGVLPLVSKLTKEQVIYHFLMGYTSKMAGTEVGVLKPTAAFSSCYGEPFLVWEPIKYARMLADKLTKHNASAFLLNTGWVGGTVGLGGNRVKLSVTRAIVDAIHNGSLLEQEYSKDPVFQLYYPKACPGVPDGMLNPADSWENKKAFYNAQEDLANKFNTKFSESYSAMVDDEIRAQGPITTEHARASKILHEEPLPNVITN